MEAALQAIAGVFYLLNKMLLMLSEKNYTTSTKRRLRILCWIAYMIGLPAWVILFVGRHNWIAAFVELSGFPAMILGFIIAIRGIEKEPPKFLNHLALIAIPCGIAISVWDFAGITTLNQCLELLLVFGFLVGTYMLAKEYPYGYVFYAIMNISCALLMWIQDWFWLFLQQCLSLGFVVFAFKVANNDKKS